MSVAVTNHPVTHPSQRRTGPPRRVRQEARDALAVFAFSATASSVLALAITVVLTLVG